ncbi:MAG: hypothetical protein GXP08_04270 [Gammaproteobacteria bacterium]|nr:hypothetical protein [Gammaproteobacteria bacterium]
MTIKQSQNILQTAVFKLLRPLIRIFLRNGLPYAAFVDLAKRAYIDVAEKEFVIDGKKQTNSRISTITGLSRKEVKRLKALSDTDDKEIVERYNRAARVVYGWVHDPSYADGHGHSIDLQFEADDLSFSSLVKEFSGDVPPRAILDELLQVGVVEKNSEGNLHLTARAYIPQSSQTEKLRYLGSDVAGLITTMDRNIHLNDKKPFFQRKVYYDNIPNEAVEKLQIILENKGQALLEFLDQWMASHDRDINEKVHGTGRKAAGIGIYYYEDDETEGCE